MYQAWDRDFPIISEGNTPSVPKHDTPFKEIQKLKNFNQND